MGAHGLYHIGYPQDSGLQEDCIPHKSLRIAGPIQPFVMLEDNLGCIAGKLNGFQDVIGHLGVGFQQGELHGVELSRLGQEA